ncbi:MAG TPA: PAS domain-containing protein [Dissulfurispiraceae bacterium]|nr:PAS domain-containing protein [Dissulfurispiraceae bacterium]
MSLKTKMTFAVSLIIGLFMTLSAFYALHLFESRIKQSIFETQKTFVERLADELDEKIVSLQNELIGMAMTFPVEILDDANEVQHYLDSRMDTNFMFDHTLVIFSPSGHMIAEHPFVPDRRGRDFSFRDYFQKTVEERIPSVSKPYFSSKDASVPAIMFTVPVFDKNGKLAAVIGGAVNLVQNSYFIKMRNIKIGGAGYVYVFAKDRTLILHPDVSRISQQDVPVGANRLFDKAIAGFEGTGDTITSRGLPVLASFKRLRTVDWIVASHYPQTQAYRPLQDARAFFYLLLIVVVLVTMVSVWLLMRNLTRPLLMLKEHVDALPHKKGGEKIFHIKTGDEIETLAEAFNTMVTEMTQKTEALQLSEARYAKAEEIAHVGHWGLDLTTSAFSASDETYRILGATRETFVNNSEQFLTAVHPDERGRVGETLDRAIREGLAYDLEHRIITPDGAVRYVVQKAEMVRDENGTPIRVMGTLRDISRRKQDEIALRKSRDFYLVLFEEFPSLIWQSGTDGLFNFFNKTWLNFTGRSFDDEAGFGWTNGIPAQDRESFLQAYRDAFAARRPFEGEFRLRRSDGACRWVITVGRPFNDVDDAFSGYIGSCYDVTDRKALEEQLHAEKRELEKAYDELKALQSQLLQQEKMSSIGQLAAGVAHEINNPIGFIISNLGSLRKYAQRLTEFQRFQAAALEQALSGEAAAGSLVERVSEQRKMMKIDYIEADIHTSIDESLEGAERVKRIVQDLKSFSRVDESESKMADINAGIESTLNIARNELKYKAKIVKELGDIPHIRCNPGQLNQVFMNMLVNAAQAMTRPGEILIRTWADSGNISVLIADTGDGISPDKLSRIFEPFFTTKEVGKGTGLGLSIAYDIIKKHGGHIDVESRVGEGTSFTITVPATE